MRWLKGLVIAMGVLIVVGLIAVAYGIARNADKLTSADLAAERALEAAFGERALEAPPGCRFAEARPLPAGRLLVRLDGLPARGCQQLLILDFANGTVKSRLTLPAE